MVSSSLTILRLLRRLIQYFLPLNVTIIIMSVIKTINDYDRTNERRSKRYDQKLQIGSTNWPIKGPETQIDSNVDHEFEMLLASSCTLKNGVHWTPILWRLHGTSRDIVGLICY